jgi:hypothetical protein
MTMTADSWRRLYGNAATGTTSCAVRGRVNLIAYYAQFGVAKADFSQFAIISPEDTTQIITSDGSFSHADSNITTNSYSIFDVLVNGTTNVKVFDKGVESTGSPKTTNIPNSTALYPYFGGYSSSPTLHCDWILLRQYLSTEPAFGSWGVEEEAGSALEGSIVWGHITGVVENIHSFASSWTGTGEVVNTGDGEEIELEDGEYMECSPVNTGTQRIEIIKDGY